MEQLRSLITWLKRYHFWVLTALIAMIGVACWYTSAGALSKQFKDYQSIIQSKSNIPRNIESQPFHPNPQISDKQKEENRKRAQSVATIWQQLYDRQRNEVLKWPDVLPKDHFRDQVEKLKFGQDIPIALCAIYQNYIQTYFPKLPAKIQSRMIEGDGGRGGFTSPIGRGGPDDPAAIAFEENYICDWNDQQTVRDLLDFGSTPSPLKIWVTQEDLWAYDTVLNVIAATNAAVQADRQDNAAVRVIELLEVGKPAAKVTRRDRIELPDTVRGSSLTQVEGDGGRAAGDSEAITADSGRGGGTFTPEQERASLLSGRYVDKDGKPISFAGATSDYQTAFGMEYKRLPVQLILRMDIRSLDYLITQCANQPLQIEVQEVRINPASIGDSGGGRGGGFEYDLMSRSGTGEVMHFPLNPHLARVVIQGVIYIFNEPNLEILKAASGEETPVAN
jgi:hypothetical protein